MTGEDATLAVVDALEALGIPYALVGSLSSNFYGISRSTKDADFVVQVELESIRKLAGKLGQRFLLDPQTSFETVTMTTRNVLTVLEIPFKIELFHLSDDPHDQERFRRRRRVKFLARELYLPTVEDVIVMKLRWSTLGKRTKDWDDARNVIAVQGERIDWDYVNSWSERHGTRAILDEIRASIPPL
jgi:hypothetical protein